MNDLSDCLTMSSVLKKKKKKRFELISINKSEQVNPSITIQILF